MRDVCVIGGASTVQQALNAGLVDELEVGVVGVLFGGAVSLFAGLGQTSLWSRRR